MMLKNPVNNELADFIAQHAKPYDPQNDNYRRPPFAIPTKAGKATPVYNAHSYHTKVPPQGIEPYIAHYTNPGDLVLDPFCGSGMTGVAALTLNRIVILKDLSPAAIHISKNYNTHVKIDLFQEEFNRIKKSLNEEMEWLYETTCDRCKGKAIINYILWCDVLACDRCGSELLMWDLTMDKEKGSIYEKFFCPSCKKEHNGEKLTWLRSVPVLTNYECVNCKPKRGEHPTTQEECDHIQLIQTRRIPYWYPSIPFNQDFEMWRGVHRTHHITDSSMFYTYRNLWGLAALWNEINKVNDQEVKEKLRFAFTAMAVKLASVMSNVSFRGPNKINLAGQLPGTLYIPTLSAERNVWNLFEDKVLGVLEFSKIVTSRFERNNLFTAIGSASHLVGIKPSSIDYVFTDPPFGSNLFYSDLNYLWESWLGNLTNQEEEAVVHLKLKDRNGFNDYARIMADSFREMFRVLKPNRWASIVFHNSDDKIWQIILDAVETAGFELAEINSFDKEQLTFKGKRGAKGLERVTNKDIVLNLRKPGPTSSRQSNGITARNGDAEIRIVQQIANFLATSPQPEQRTLQHFWNVVLYDMLGSGQVDSSMEKVGNMLPYYFKQVDGHWYLRGETIIGGNVFDLKTDLGAISWLSAILSVLPQTIGDLIPKWQEATVASGLTRDVDPDRLEHLLDQNFWLDKRTNRWRIPTEIEQRQMSAAEDISAEVHLRVIRRFIAGEGTHIPSARELGAWIQFAYNRKAYGEAVGLYKFIDESQLDQDYVLILRKMIQVSRLRARKS